MSEFTAGVTTLLRKIVQFRPRIVCFVGKSIWDSFERAILVDGQKRGAKATFEFDIQPYKVVHLSGALAWMVSTSSPTDSTPAAGDNIRETLFFVVCSTSGRVANYQVCLLGPFLTSHTC